MQKPHETDTIAAPITPIGGGAVTVIRLSGENAIQVLKKIYKTSSEDAFSSRGISYGHINGENGRILDEVLVTVMPAPKSYTMEDVVEISCHGGALSGAAVLERIINCGARLAEPGEFTKRAFVNGRIDLSQAEAVVDIINASTELARSSALNRLGGRLSHRINEYRSDILKLLADIEVSIDYPEHDMDHINIPEIERQCKRLLDQINMLISSAEDGKILKDGVQTAIVGRPNVGKSSLLNALLGEERAIVTEIAGTTRDTVSELINIGGVPFRLNDTAGIRSTDDAVEKIGVERATALAAAADLIILTLDSSEQLAAEDEALFELIAGKKAIAVLNKHDLPQRLNKDAIPLGDMPIVYSSMKKGEGIDELTALMGKMYQNAHKAAEEAAPVTLRHKTALSNAAAALKSALNAISAGLTEDIVSIDLQECLRCLGEITGETVDDDIIDRIFSEFCLGK